MPPLHHQTRLPNQQHQIRHHKSLAQTTMRPTPKHHPIPRLPLRIPRHPALRIKDVRLRIRHGIMRNLPHRRHEQHPPPRDKPLRQTEIPPHRSRQRNRRRAIPQRLLDHRLRDPHAVQHRHRRRRTNIPIPHPQILLPDLLQPRRVVRDQLEQPRHRAAGGVQRGEVERQQRLRDLAVAEVAEQMRGPLGVVERFAGRVACFPLPGVVHLFDPVVEHAGHLPPGRDVEFRADGAAHELLDDFAGHLAAVPLFREWQDEREVDEFQRGSDVVEIVRDLQRLLERQIVPQGDARARHSREFFEHVHERGGFAAHGDLAEVDEFVKVLFVRAFENGEVGFDGAAVEQAVQASAVDFMRLAVEEDPVGGTEEFLRAGGAAEADVFGGVPDFAGEVFGGD